MLRTPPPASLGGQGLSSKKKAKHGLQSAIRRALQQHMSDWRDDCEQIELILQSLLGALHLHKAIYKTSYSTSHWKEHVLDRFPGVLDVLLAKVFKDIDGLCAQLKTFQKRLFDVQLCVQMKANESIAMVSNERIEEDSSQDTCDWALEAQCMQKQLSLEYRRKAALLQSIQQRWELSGGDDLAVNALTEDFLAECMGKWTADGSCVEEIMRCLS